MSVIAIAMQQRNDSPWRESKCHVKIAAEDPCNQQSKADNFIVHCPHIHHVGLVLGAAPTIPPRIYTDVIRMIIRFK